MEIISLLQNFKQELINQISSIEFGLNIVGVNDWRKRNKNNKKNNKK